MHQGPFGAINPGQIQQLMQQVSRMKQNLNKKKRKKKKKGGTFPAE